MQERNPYAAPLAPVADAAEPVPAGRPVEVRRAVQLLLAAMVISTVGGFFSPQNQFGLTMRIALTVLGIVLWLWIISKLSAGRNWARVLFAVLTAIGYAFLPFTWKLYATMFKGHPVFAVTTVVNSALDLYALYLLFTRPARAWFRPRGQPVR